MSVKIRVKLGEVEIECEGSEEFVRTELLDIARDLIRLGGGVVPTGTATGTPPGVPADTSPGVPAGTPPGMPAEPVSPKVGRLRLSISDVADRLATSSGSDLLVAAAAYHTFVLGTPAFDRSDLLVTMRQAPDYYKRSYTNNLSGYISTLVKREVFVEVETDVYALSSATQEELAAQLGV